MGANGENRRREPQAEYPRAEDLEDCDVKVEE